MRWYALPIPTARHPLSALEDSVSSCHPIVAVTITWRLLGERGIQKPESISRPNSLGWLAEHSTTSAPSDSERGNAPTSRFRRLRIGTLVAEKNSWLWSAAEPTSTHFPRDPVVGDSFWTHSNRAIQKWPHDASAQDCPNVTSPLLRAEKPERSSRI